MTGRRLTAHGLSVPIPAGWDARIERREGHTVLHAATRRLPRLRGDYGSGLVETMTARDIFVALVEFDREAGETAMFSGVGMPTLRLGDFDRSTQQRVIPGMCGTQQFLVVSGRAFCCYVVLGSWLMRASLVVEANRVVPGIDISP